MATLLVVRYLLDTNILVQYVRANEVGRRIEARYSLRSGSVTALISVVTRGEIEALARDFGWGAQKLQTLRTLLGEFVTVPLEFPGIIDAYADIYQFCRQTRTIQQNDLWIAATARATGARLLTTDRDFDHLHPTYLTRDWIDPSEGAQGVTE